MNNCSKGKGKGKGKSKAMIAVNAINTTSVINVCRAKQVGLLSGLNRSKMGR